MKNTVYIVVGVLAVLAIVLAVAIYKQQTTAPKSQLPASTQPVVKQQVTQPAPLKTLPSAEEENLVKNVPPLNASAADKLAFYKKLQQYAKDATTVEITNCKPSPLIARVKENSAPYITNMDNVGHDLRLGSTDLKVSAKGTIAVKIGKIEQFTNFDCVGGFSGIWISQ